MKEKTNPQFLATFRSAASVSAVSLHDVLNQEGLSNDIREISQGILKYRTCYAGSHHVCKTQDLDG